MLRTTNFSLLIKNEQLIAKTDSKWEKYSLKTFSILLKFNRNVFITGDYLSVASAT